jgi:myosin heavy subunit
MESCTDVPSIDDKKEYEIVVQAFKDLEFSVAERDCLFNVVAGVAALGNVTFREGKPDQSEVDPKSSKWVDAAATNIGVDPSVLSVAMVTREIRVRGQEATRAVLNETQASDARHALGKFMYGRMFDWLVQRINKSMGNSKSSTQYVGILDIFG